jgi:arylsulfatase A-like enzyme
MKRRAKLLAVPSAVAIAGIVLWPDKPQPVGDPAEPPYLTVFMVDGLALDVFEAELEAGRLPNIRRLIEDGTYVERGVSSFPSMTGYGFYPLLTGQDATESGVLGLRWFDRARAVGNFRTYVGKTNVEMNEDLVVDRKTLFEHFEGAHSFTINSYNNRGAKSSVKMGFEFTAAKYEGHWWVADVLSAIPIFEETLSPDWPEVELHATNLALADLAHRPKIQWITFVSPDTYAHVNGLGPRYPELIRTIDRMIGIYRARAEELGLDDERVYAFVSDHGVEEVSRNVDLVEVLANHGLSAFRGEATELFTARKDDTLADFGALDAVVVVNGNLMNYLYFKKPAMEGVEAWRHRITIDELSAYPVASSTAPLDLVRLLLAADGVEHVIGHGERGFEIHGRRGSARIEREGAMFSYLPQGEDPLGYAGDPIAAPLADGRLHPIDRWLEATQRTRYPYAPVRLARLMSKEGAGDLIVTSAEGFDLAKDYELFVGNYRGGHGGMRAAQMLVPYVLAGPGVARGARVSTAPIEDAGATLLLLMGAAPEAGALGSPLSAAISAP